MSNETNQGQQPGQQKNPSTGQSGEKKPYGDPSQGNEQQKRAPGQEQPNQPGRRNPEQEQDENEGQERKRA
jgi:hypothetical protein